MPDKLILFSVAVPLALVVALPTEVPFRVKAIILPLTFDPFEVKAAEMDVLPPYVPVAEFVLSEVLAVLLVVKVREVDVAEFPA
jgi:hypothetical protein